jgi:CRISPR system Cascade subunit CasE
MYLSRLILDPRNRAVRRDIANCQQLHRTVLSAFPDAPGVSGREHFGTLHRLDVEPRTGLVTLLVQSAVEPDWAHLPPGYLVPVESPDENPGQKDITATYDAITTGQILRFRLRANVTKKIGTATKAERLAGARSNGQRVPVRGAETLTWLARKGEAGGFRISGVTTSTPDTIADVMATPQADARGWRRGDGASARITITPVVFDGRLLVTDADRFRQTIVEGIGPAKAYGCGLLSVAPMR